MSLRYGPGQAPVVVTPLGFVVLDPGTPASLAARIRSLVADGRGLGGVIEALTEAHGASLTAIPPFAVALPEGDSVRFAVRGDVTLVVETRDGAVELSGAGVTTWTERMIPAVARISVAVGTPATPAELPLLDGVALASVIEWDAVARPAAVVTDHAPAAAPAGDLPAEAIAPGRAVPPAPPAAEDSPAGFDELWGETIVRAPAESPVDATEEPLTEVSVEIVGDHDGRTISLAEARAMRDSSGDPLPAHDSTPTPLAPPRRPAPGRIRVSSGQVVALDRTVVIGRRPRSTRVSGTDLPHLIAVDSPEQDISRSHVELRVEGDSILATDLRTTNGTTLLRHGAEPMRLHPGEATVVVPGDVLDLGDGITVAVEELP